MRVSQTYPANLANSNEQKNEGKRFRKTLRKNEHHATRKEQKTNMCMFCEAELGRTLA